MKTASGRGLLILVSFSLIVSMFVPMGMIGDAQASGPTYASHSVIRTNNNNDLAALISSGGGTGSGTIANPYVIKGYDITGTGGACIYIGNSTKYLVISECRLRGNTAGIELFYTSYAKISGNNCIGNGIWGIKLAASSHNVIENNNITGAGRDDMFFQDSNSNIIQNNTSTASLHCSNWLSNSNDNIISNNTSSGSGGCGLQIQSSDNNTISNNNISGNAQHGIRLFDSSNHNTVIRNICGDNSYSGISLSFASTNSVAFNICSGNTQYGISQYSSNSNGIYGNELIDNNGASSRYDRSHVQAYDDGANRWNSSSYGNFWGDWIVPDLNNDGIVDDPYLIGGAGGAKDYLPTISCSGLHFELGGPSQALKGDDISWSFRVRNEGKATLLNVIVIDPILNKTWRLGDMTSGGSLQWSYLSAIPSYENVSNIAYATGTDVYGGLYNVSDSHIVSVLRPPSSPQGLTVTVGDGGAILTWTAPSSNGGTPITDYQIFRGTSSSGESYLDHTSSGSTLTFTDSGLTNGQTYYYQVNAVNSVGDGSRCSERTGSPRGPPAAPQYLQATAGNSQVFLSWSAPSSDGGATVDYYIVYQNATDVLHVTSTSVTITGLANGQTNSFTVSAHNSVNAGPQSTAVSVTTIPGIAVPGVPTGLTATPGNGQLSISWLAPSSNGGGAIDYYLVYVNGAVRSDHYATTSATVAGLTNGHSYNFTVAAHNSAGIGTQSSTGTAIPSPVLAVPGIPSGLIVTPGNTQISLSWTLPSSDGGANIDYYLINVNGVVMSDHYTALSRTFTGLTNGQQYDFTVAAHNSVGIGSPSSVATATPSLAPTVPGAPTGLIITPGNAQVSLSWTAPTNNGCASIDYYIVYLGGIDISHPNATSKMITSLMNGESYSFTVAAHNSIGIGAQSSEVLGSASSSADLPGTPGDLITTVGDGLVKLSWMAPSGSSGIDYYVVYQNDVDVGHPSGNSTTIAGLTNGQNYSFTVAAHNPYGVGTRSSAQTLSPIASVSDGAKTSLGNDSVVYFLGGLALLAGIIALVLVVWRKKKGQ